MPLACAPPALQAIWFQARESAAIGTHGPRSSIPTASLPREIPSAKWMPVLLADIVQRADIGMIMPEASGAFALKTSHAAGIVRQFIGKELKATMRPRRVTFRLINQPIAPSPILSTIRSVRHLARSVAGTRASTAADETASSACHIFYRPMNR